MYWSRNDGSCNWKYLGADSRVHRWCIFCWRSEKRRLRDNWTRWSLSRAKFRYLCDSSVCFLLYFQVQTLIDQENCGCYSCLKHSWELAPVHCSLMVSLVSMSLIPINALEEIFVSLAGQLRIEHSWFPALYMIASTVGPALAFVGCGFMLRQWGDWRTTPQE